MTPKDELAIWAVVFIASGIGALYQVGKISGNHYKMSFMDSMFVLIYIGFMILSTIEISKI